jgi:hypothetical protein
MPQVAVEAKLTPFSAESADSQGLAVHELVNGDADWHWLEHTQPGTFRRYETRAIAIQTIGRLATEPEIEAYVIEDNRTAAAIGLATIIHERQIRHPVAGELNGDDLDYWLSLKFADDELAHKAVVTALVGQGWGLLPKRKLYEISHAMFATVAIDSPNPARGFELSNHLQPWGEPARLTTDLDDSQFGITRGGAVVQVYRLPVQAPAMGQHIR